MKRVVVAEPIHQDGLAALETVDEIELIAFEAPATPDELRGAVAEANAILVRTLPLGADILQIAPHLEIVSKHGIGCDNIDVAHMSARGLPVSISADANATSVAEHTLMLILACAKRLPEQEAAARAADWSFRQRTKAFELSGKTALVIGMGRVGKRVAGLCKAFGMEVIGYDPAAEFSGINMTDNLDTALKAAQVVTVHTPLTAETRGLLDANRLQRMQPGAILVNCARGGVIDEPSLIAALTEGPLAMLGTDVFVTEPIVADDPLLKLPNVIATAHTGAMTAESKRAMAMQSTQNIIDHFAGKLDPTVVFNRSELNL